MPPYDRHRPDDVLDESRTRGLAVFLGGLLAPGVRLHQPWAVWRSRFYPCPARVTFRASAPHGVFDRFSTGTAKAGIDFIELVYETSFRWI